ncbi:uncharacterized protein LOC125185181 [Salvia hispanica]|uniref:uncharacterized protein LOC125185181 n=1 Tax=Salvia hispanica TaxID=49212 RepID=UPI002009088D|nr:uncharacterized protein LOC125185181 [Salvia hispanica]
MEEESFVHMCHEHPLSLIPDSAKRQYIAWCYGCSRHFIPEDAAYGCSLRCEFYEALHEECMEMPREVMHPIHPSHPLTLHHSPLNLGSIKCAFCEESVSGLHYRCSHGGCDGFVVHLRCVGGFKDNNETQLLMYHPSHPQHQLRFAKKTRWCPFPCDACGATEKGDSYTCSLCDYSIHESCALLPESKEFPVHHHSLSLAFYPPREFGDENENAIEDQKEVTKFPIAVDDMYEEIIRPFVKRQSGQLSVPHGDHDNQNTGGKYRFFSHPHHLLTFTPTFSSASSSSPSSSSHRYWKIEDEEEDDDVESIPRLELTCDGCALPIREKKQTDDDDYENENGYMSCDECKYFLHLSCFNLPLEIPSLPIHPRNDHSLMLRNVDGDFYCNSCENLMFRRSWMYYCRDCDQSFDPECFPATSGTARNIKYGAEQYVISSIHDHPLRFQIITNKNICDLCSDDAYDGSGFKCASCFFVVCISCGIRHMDDAQKAI